jgi:hypothetical protein
MLLFSVKNAGVKTAQFWLSMSDVTCNRCWDLKSSPFCLLVLEHRWFFLLRLWLATPEKNNKQILKVFSTHWLHKCKIPTGYISVQQKKCRVWNGPTENTTAIQSRCKIVFLHVSNHIKSTYSCMHRTVVCKHDVKALFWFENGTFRVHN